MKADYETKQAKNNVEYEFWKRSFGSRTKKWQRDTLKRLKASVSLFETSEENVNKINALESLLA